MSEKKEVWICGYETEEGGKCQRVVPYKGMRCYEHRDTSKGGMFRWG